MVFNCMADWYARDFFCRLLGRDLEEEGRQMSMGVAVALMFAIIFCAVGDKMAEGFYMKHRISKRYGSKRSKKR